MNSSKKVARYLFGHVYSVTFQILVLKKGVKETSTSRNDSQSCLTPANIKITWLGRDWFNRALCSLTDRRGVIEPITPWCRMVELLAHDLCNQVEAVDFPVYCFRYFGGHAARRSKTNPNSQHVSLVNKPYWVSLQHEVFLPWLVNKFIRY